MVHPKKILYSVAIDENGNLCEASNCNRDRKYFCIGCNSEMILKRKIGGKRRPHFSHKPTEEKCSPETVLHILFKRKLYTKLHDCIDYKKSLIFEWECDKCNGRHSGNLVKRAKKVKLESKVGSYIPDITLYDKNEYPYAVIEIVVTHSPEVENIEFYKNHGIILIIIKLENYIDLYMIENSLFASYVNFCPNPICKKHNTHTVPRILKIVNTKCWKCDNSMKAAVIDFEYGEGPETFTKEELRIAHDNGVLIKPHYSKTSRQKYLSNTCKKCNSFFGRFFIGELTEIHGKEFITDYVCKECKYEN